MYNTRFVVEEVKRDDYSSFRVRDVEEIHGCQYLTDNEGLTLVFYTRERAQAYADEELTCQVEYEQEQERCRHVWP